jgi:hypothetical protein
LASVALKKRRGRWRSEFVMKNILLAFSGAGALTERRIIGQGGSVSNPIGSKPGKSAFNPMVARTRKNPSPSLDDICQEC